jgi:hypothetical protein
MKKYLFYLLAILVVSGCFKTYVDPPLPSNSNEGYRPIYVSREEIEKVVFTTPQPLKSPGKIYIKDDYLFVNEANKGVHVFDNKDPKKPVKIAFLSIPGNVDIAIRGTILYADNGRDLLSIDVTKPAQSVLLNRMKDAFPNQDFPPQFNVKFECIDSNKGIVVGWEKVAVKDFKLNCYR